MSIVLILDIIISDSIVMLEVAVTFHARRHGKVKPTSLVGPTSYLILSITTELVKKIPTY